MAAAAESPNLAESADLQLFVLALDARLAVQQFSRHAWLFNLADPRAKEELAAAAKQFGDFHATKPTAFDGEMLIMRRSLSESNLRALILDGVTGFAALSCWGCGPLSGFSYVSASAPMAETDLLPLLERAIFDAQVEEARPKIRATRI